MSHCLRGDAGVGVHLFQHLVDVNTVRFFPLGLAFLSGLDDFFSAFPADFSPGAMFVFTTVLLYGTARTSDTLTVGLSYLSYFCGATMCVHWSTSPLLNRRVTTLWWKYICSGHPTFCLCKSTYCCNLLHN